TTKAWLHLGHEIRLTAPETFSVVAQNGQATSMAMAGQFLVMVSCKFKIVRVTLVHAANSAMSIPFGVGRSPVPSNFCAAALSERNSFKCFSKRAVSTFSSVG